MTNKQRQVSPEEGRVSMLKLYAMLCGLKTSVDRLAVQVKQLRNEREADTNE